MEAALQGKRLTIRYVYDEYPIPPPLFLLLLFARSLFTCDILDFHALTHFLA